MRAPATATGRRQAFSICITASCSSPSPHWRYLTGAARGTPAPRHCHGQKASFLHLHHGFVFQPFAPLAVFDWFGAWRRGSIDNGFGQLLAHWVLRKQSGNGDNCLQFLFQFGFVSSTGDELGNMIGRPPGGLTWGG